MPGRSARTGLLFPLPRDQDRIVPFVTFVVVLREVFPLGFGDENFEAGITSNGAQSVGIHSPAIDRETVLGPARGDDDAAEAVRFQRPRNLPRCFPEKFGVFEGLGNSAADYADAETERPLL